MRVPSSQQKIPIRVQIKVLNPGEMLRARLESSLTAQLSLTAQQVHRQMRKNGSVPSPNPFYTGQRKPEDCFRVLNSMNSSLASSF